MAKRARNSGVSRKAVTTIYITEEQQTLLRELNQRTKVPVAEYIRQGIDMVLDIHRDKLPGQMDLNESLPLGQSKKGK